MLALTEEEKRTLIAEGYPVPVKLPLSKQEEKSLKKVRRKIKNKVCDIYQRVYLNGENIGMGEVNYHLIIQCRGSFFKLLVHFYFGNSS